MATEQAFPSTAVAVGGGRVITTPFQFVADADTFLRVTTVCSASGVSLAIQGRRLDGNGRIQPIVETHAPAANRTTRAQDYLLGQGALLNVTVFAAQGAPTIGQCYVMVQILRNFGSTAIVLGTLIAGYVTSVQALGFPGSPIQSSFDGQGAIRSILGTDPTPGAQIAESVPTGARWRLITFLAVLNTNAVVASRVPYLIAVVGIQNMFASPPAASIPASFVQNVQWYTGYTTFVTGGTLAQAASLPNALLLAGGTSIITVTEQFQGTDNWDAPRMLVEEWLEVT